jgi:hypothetical protein
MKITRTYMFAIAATLLAGEIVHADEIEQIAEKRPSTAVYEGVAVNGTVVRLTIPDHNVETFERLSPPRSTIQAAPHWSSLFGTGTAAEAEREP